MEALSKVPCAMPLTFKVPYSHKNKGQRILNFPAALTFSTVEALRPPKKHKISIQGKLVQEEEFGSVQVGARKVTMKN